MDCFTLTQRRDVVQDRRSDCAHVSFVITNAVGSEAPDDQVPLRLVLWIVHVDHRLVGAQVDVRP